MEIQRDKIETIQNILVIWKTKNVYSDLKNSLKRLLYEEVKKVISELEMILKKTVLIA